ncbi:hypothetical protein DFH11DRAFT_1548486 [Phellopilus nigrolimitatus]|nr:hypothetical protein DFH11DRAFT_1548486 [Phellopilus nigrolimitatus]
MQRDTCPATGRILLRVENVAISSSFLEIRTRLSSAQTTSSSSWPALGSHPGVGEDSRRRSRQSGLSASWDQIRSDLSSSLAHPRADAGLFGDLKSLGHSTGPGRVDLPKRDPKFQAMCRMSSYWGNHRPSTFCARASKPKMPHTPLAGLLTFSLRWDVVFAYLLFSAASLLIELWEHLAIRAIPNPRMKCCFYSYTKGTEIRSLFINNIDNP